MTPLQKAKDLMEKGQYLPAITILNDLNGLSPRSENYRLLFMADCWFRLEEYNWAIDIADKLLQKDERNELASMMKYLSYCSLKDFDNALAEIVDFLSNNEADLYKVTLEELLTDIKDGFITDKEIISKIKELALQNNCLK
ncbi:tetratricopeptide (TPR) repeat protein [Chryseobacterium sediminis]|uniref:Tetratricopeptide (TPR) repeat protein n=1 Tax=Chryseobacterium sediminis TaxID=1679494 RepID=A0ABR6PYK0_9FLAO|nr:hypothetical protein [Chryseobacterium sediminis]MBB6330137.1 tetratricopeptide (TPR) repeat protein [Chryseobacterium sediminis]